MAVRDQGREARTGYEVLGTLKDPEVSLVTCRLETGRTHQIRVHLSAIGHSIVGDPVYKGTRGGIALTRPFLHAAYLGFHHPITGEAMAFEAPLPAELQNVLDELGLVLPPNPPAAPKLAPK